VSTVAGIATQRPGGGAGTGIVAPNTGAGGGDGGAGGLTALAGMAAAAALGAALIAGAAVVRRRG